MAENFWRTLENVSTFPCAVKYFLLIMRLKLWDKKAISGVLGKCKCYYMHVLMKKWIQTAFICLDMLCRWSN